MNILFQGFALGLVGGIIPGAVLTVLFVSTMQGGLFAGIRAFLWAFLAEISIVGVLLYIALQLPLHPDVFVAIGGIGGIVLLYFARQVFQLRSIEAEGSPILFTAPKIFLLQTTNAPLYIFWLTICFPLIWQLAKTWPLVSAAISYFAVFEIGWAISTLAVLLLFNFSRITLTNERIMRVVFIIISTVFALFGFRMLISAFTSLLN